ncbi:hypothetical protein HGP17_24055 [Rhizobium sp. P38BS-XIX]|uniref:hypothetical protein n=1 Tax=Rhizobium sp. P38BS-XIX TaxID=2726740 RepID=UPI0014578543|nr:hypothetical protein [Rhizobium sp. P38BS-XIX]NLR99908.1 hypothetical protein [Rhizobium sp. P38BS-XIX]
MRNFFGNVNPIFLICALALSSSPALAISRIDATRNTCGELRSAIASRGAAIVTHPGSRQSGTLYDRYVSDSGHCNSGEVATDDWVPAKDRSCRLQNCQPYEPPFD